MHLIPPLPHPDNHYLRSAIGWHELGDQREAQVELAQISPAFQNHPEVLSTQWLILAAQEKWEDALHVATEMLSVCPDRVDAWIHQAYATRRTAGGGIPQAREILLAAATKFPNEVMIAYNLACYACQIGELDESRSHLTRAAQLGGLDAVKKLALKDPDLLAVKDFLNEM